MADREEQTWDFGAGLMEFQLDQESPVQQNSTQRGQLAYPLDLQSEGSLKRSLENVEKDVIRKRNRVALNLDTTATSFNVASDYMVLTADSTTTVSKIGGGREGQILTLQFSDSYIVLSDNDSSDLETINLSAAFTSSGNDVVQLLYDGTSWRETSRSAN